MPPVHERLSPELVVVDPVDSIGKYAGHLAHVDRVLGRHADAWCDGLQAIGVMDRSGRKVVPGLAKRWEVLDGGRTYRFHLCQGIR